MGNKNTQYLIDQAQAVIEEIITPQAIQRNMDASDVSLYVARQLTYNRAKAIEKPNAPLEAFDVFMVSTDIPAGAETANYFSASGFHTSTAGQAGSGGAITASTTTFLSGGGTAGAGDQTGNYGYTVSGLQSGYFMLQPIIVGVGSGGVNGRVAGIGCGGSYSGSDRGGPGMVLIASW